MKDFFLKSPTFWLCVVCAIIGCVWGSFYQLEGMGLVIGALFGVVLRIFYPLCRAMVGIVGDVFS